MNSMTKHIPVCKNMTGNREQDAEEESSASEGERETVGKSTGKEAVGKSTGKTPDTQNVQDVTETVMETRMMEEIPPNTWEQVPRRLSTERREVTGEPSSCTERVWFCCYILYFLFGVKILNVAPYVSRRGMYACVCRWAIYVRPCRV